jgi:hypothetical protein
MKQHTGTALARFTLPTCKMPLHTSLEEHVVGGKKHVSWEGIPFLHTDLLNGG